MDLEVVDREDITAQFFAPVSSDVLDALLGQYQSMLMRIEGVAGVMEREQDAIRYFLTGNTDRHDSGGSSALQRLLKPDGAVAALNASYWSKALALTDVLECMPKARRDEWSKQVLEMTTPPFTEEAVRPTMLSLLQSREKFFAERVDGIFRGLSGTHVTNTPEAFGKRMILAGMANEYGSYCYERAGLINDFRAVVGKFMGREGAPGWSDTQGILKQARAQRGQWLSCDGGSWRLRVYKIGTAHLEVHPDMAWRLNCVLAQLYPLAIPAQFRATPKKRSKEFEMLGRPLPFEVVSILAAMGPASEFYKVGFQDCRRPIENTLYVHGYGIDKVALAQAEKVVESIGGVKQQRGHYLFDYEPSSVLAEIVATGCVPDRVAHQFYPTPESIASLAAEMAQIGPDDTVLEPSAGQGDLAAFLPKDRTTCVEISPLHCAILKAKGHDPVQADFIAWAKEVGIGGAQFDAIVMNPPFSQGRWKAHTEAAASLLAPGGRLVAVLPASAKGKDVLPGFAHEWAGPYANEFAGTSVSVVILLAQAQPVVA